MRAARLLAWLAALAMPLTASAAAPFRLASDDGRRWYAPGELGGKPSVFLFWDVDCAPCLAELKNARTLRAAWPEAVVVIASLSPRDASARALGRYQVPADVRRAMAPADPRGLLARLGNRAGALPFTAAFRADGRRCAARLGPLDAQQMRALAARC